MLHLVLCLFSTLAVSATYTGQHQQEWPDVVCPDRCHCVYRFSDRFQASLRTVDCTNAGYASFPNQIPIDAQSLILRRNRLRSPFEARIWLPELIHLDMSHNRIIAIDDGQQRESTLSHGRYPSRKTLFDGVYNLRVLDLSRNQVTNLDNGAFEGLFNLEELNLAENRLARIADDAFRGLFKLESLKLSSNRLAYIQSAWWHHTRTLYDLALDGNYINVVQAQSFHLLSSLLTLNLARNKIFRMHDDALAGLDRLENLYLQSNSLTALNRDALRGVRSSLKSINIGRNPLLAICTDDFANLPRLKDISASGMPRLRIIERGAFKNLPNLLMVEMHDNPYLAYVDATAFVNTPEVTHLLVHNNNLTVLERELLDSLPSLEEVSLYGNPLTCDCNMRWMQEMAQGNGEHQRTIRFPEFERLVCDSPYQHRFRLFSSLAPADFGERCVRMIENLFDPENERKMGDDITYRCRAVGQPKPKLFWTAPSQNQRPIDATDYHPRRALYNGNTLVVRRIKPEDAGPYVCVAENVAGTAMAATELTVADISIKLQAARIGATSATFEWNGTDRENHVFQILFRQSSEHQRHYAATVTPIMKSYTVYSLQPNTDYEACMTLVDGDEVVLNISCTTFKTGQLESALRKMERTGNVAVGAALGVVSCMLIVVCLAAVACKRSNSSVDSSTNMNRVNSDRRLCSSTNSLNTVAFYSIDNLYSPLLSSNDTGRGRYVIKKPWGAVVRIDEDSGVPPV